MDLYPEQVDFQEIGRIIWEDHCCYNCLMQAVVYLIRNHLTDPELPKFTRYRACLMLDVALVISEPGDHTFSEQSVMIMRAACQAEFDEILAGGVITPVKHQENWEDMRNRLYYLRLAA